MKQSRWLDIAVIVILAAMLGMFLRPGSADSGTTSPGPVTSRGATTPAGSSVGATPPPVASLDEATPGPVTSSTATSPPREASHDAATPAPTGSPRTPTSPNARTHSGGERWVEGHLSIWGISLGSSRSDVERVWGASVMQNNTPTDGIAYVYSRKAGATWEGPTVYYDAQDRVRIVSGESLEKDGLVVPDSALGVHGAPVHLDLVTDNGQLKVWRTGVAACSDPELRTPIVERTSFMLVAGHDE